MLNIFNYKMFRKGKCFIILGLFMLAVSANSEALLNPKLLDQWLQASEELNSIPVVKDAFNNNKKLQNIYTSEKFRKLGVVEQDEMVDTLLKQEGLYDKVYPIVKKYNWRNAGDFMRISERMGVAIGVHLQKMMTANLPPEQAKLLIAAAGGNSNLKAPAKDVAFVAANWQKISGFIAKNFNFR